MTKLCNTTPETISIILGLFDRLNDLLTYLIINSTKINPNIE